MVTNPLQLKTGQSIWPSGWKSWKPINSYNKQSVNNFNTSISRTFSNIIKPKSKEDKAQVPAEAFLRSSQRNKMPCSLWLGHWQCCKGTVCVEMCPHLRGTVLCRDASIQYPVAVFSIISLVFLCPESVYLIIQINFGQVLLLNSLGHLKRSVL